MSDFTCCSAFLTSLVSVALRIDRRRNAMVLLDLQVARGPFFWSGAEPSRGFLDRHSLYSMIIRGIVADYALSPGASILGRVLYSISLTWSIRLVSLEKPDWAASMAPLVRVMWPESTPSVSSNLTASVWTPFRTSRSSGPAPAACCAQAHQDDPQEIEEAMGRGYEHILVLGVTHKIVVLVGQHVIVDVLRRHVHHREVDRPLVRQDVLLTDVIGVFFDGLTELLGSHSPVLIVRRPGQLPEVLERELRIDRDDARVGLDHGVHGLSVAEFILCRIMFFREHLRQHVRKDLLADVAGAVSGAAAR